LKKILLISDSTAYPRSKSLGEETIYEKTYPYLLKIKYKNFEISNICFGGISTNQLFNQAISYYKEWNPDIVIINSGINDCRTFPISDRLIQIISLCSIKLYNVIEKLLFKDFIQKNFSKPNTSLKKFKKIISRFEIIFDQSKIIWIEIVADKSYDQVRYNTSKYLNEYNNLLFNKFDKNFIKVKDDIIQNNGIQKDGFHLNERGHNVIYNKLIHTIENIIS